MIETANKEKITEDCLQWIYDSDNFILNRFFNNDEIVSLLHYSQLISYNAGDFILKQGVKSEGIFIILEGTVSIEEKILGKNKLPLGNLLPGYFVGGVSFIGNEPSPTSCMAQTNSRCLFIPKTYLTMIAFLSPAIYYKLMQAITQQVCLHLTNLHEKVIDYIANSDMSKLSLYGRVVYSLTKPSALLATEVEEYQSILRTQSKTFESSDWDDLFALSHLIEAPKNCKLAVEAEKAGSCYIVVRGAIQSCIMKNNKLAKLSIIGPYTLFANYIAENPFNLTFISCEHSILLKIDANHLQIIEKECPSLWYKIFNLICKSMVALQKSIDKLDSRLQIEHYNR